MAKKVNVEALKAQLAADVPAFSARVAPLYHQLDWLWLKHDGYDIPTVADITQTLLKLIADEAGMEISTGGLAVWVTESEAGMAFQFEHVVQHE